MKRKAYFRSFFFVFLVFPFVVLSAQRIENVHTEVEGDSIHIKYDLLGIAPGQSVFVSVYMSTEGGEVYGDPLKSVSGDVGWVTEPGRDKTITWDVFRDLDELISVNVKFKVTASLLNGDSGERSGARTVQFSLKPGIGCKTHLNYASTGMHATGLVYLDRLGLGLRGDYYRTLHRGIDYVAADRVFSDTGYYWGYSAGAIIEYDFLRNAVLQQILTQVVF